MASKGNKKRLSDRNKGIIGGIVGFLIVIIGLGLIFGTPSAEAVFKDMNEKMLQTKSVTVDQKLTMKDTDGSTNSIGSRLFMDFNSSKQLLSKGSFSLSLVSSGSPISVGGDLIKIGDTSYVRYSDISSTNRSLASSFSAVESKLKDKWIKVRSNDQFVSFATTPLEFTSNIFPTPYANLDDTQRKAVLALLQDKSMYTIGESSKVDVSGVSAYKYSITYNKTQFNKVAKAIAGYISYFKSDDSSSSSELTSLTVWVDISTKQIIKIEYTGTSKSGNVTGTIAFSGYNQSQTVEKPSDYSIESELLN